MAGSPFWTQDPAEAASALGCTLAGLTTVDAAARLATYGRNADQQAREAGVLRAVGRRLLEPMCLILIAAAIVSAVTGDVPSALIILVILAASVTLDTVQEGSAKRAAEALRQSVALKAEVKRDGAFVSVDAETVVPGDVFRVGVGDIIPADALVLDDPDGGYRRLLLRNDRLVGAVLYGATEDAPWYMRLIRDARPLGALRDVLPFGPAFA